MSKAPWTSFFAEHDQKRKQAWKSHFQTCLYNIRGNLLILWGADYVCLPTLYVFYNVLILYIFTDFSILGRTAVTELHKLAVQLPHSLDFQIQKKEAVLCIREEPESILHKPAEQTYSKILVRNTSEVGRYGSGAKGKT